MKWPNVFATIIVLALTACNFKPTSQSPQVVNDSKPDVIIYSGGCTKYKLEIVPPNHMSRKELGQAFAKLIINRSTKHMNFYFDDKLIFSTDNLLSFVDDAKGGEGFDGDNGTSAYRLIAERKLTVHYNNPFGRANENDVGYEYQITSYVEN